MCWLVWDGERWLDVMVITSGFTMAAMVNRFFAWKLVKVDEIEFPGIAI